MKNSKKTKKIGLIQLVMLGLGSLIGSGWLFGAWEASQVAGPAAIISWVIGVSLSVQSLITTSNWEPCSRNLGG